MSDESKTLREAPWATDQTIVEKIASSITHEIRGALSMAGLALLVVFRVFTMMPDKNTF